MEPGGRDWNVSRGGCFLTQSSWLALLAFFLAPRTTRPGVALLPVKSALPINQLSRKCPPGKLVGVFSQWRFPLPK